MENTQELLALAPIDKTDITCTSVDPCVLKERTLSYAVGVEVPEPGITPDEIFKECCYTHYTLADLTSNDDYKNDYSGFYHQRQLLNESVEFVLYHFEQDQEYDLDDDTYGKLFNFGDFDTNTNLKGYLVQWQKVLQEIGEGSYQIIKRQTIASIDIEFKSFVFTLRQYSTSLANGTTRLDVVMNGILKASNVDFSGTNWQHSIRVPGYFGDREPQFEEDILVTRQFDKQQISMEQSNEYKYQTNLIPSCVTDEIFDFILFANNIFVTDYNLNNHSYSYLKHPVRYAGNEGSRYPVRSRKAQLNLLFSDQSENRRKNNYF